MGIQLAVHDANSYVRRDTIEFYIGTPSPIYSENFNDGIGQWITSEIGGLQIILPMVLSP